MKDMLELLRLEYEQTQRELDDAMDATLRARKLADRAEQAEILARKRRDVACVAYQRAASEATSPTT